MLIVDDNMLLRSMRKQYFQLARAHGFGFVQLSLVADEAVSVARNATRGTTTRIPIGVLRDSHARNEVGR